jgi:hypothetical protein
MELFTKLAKEIENNKVFMLQTAGSVSFAGLNPKFSLWKRVWFLSVTVEYLNVPVHL